MSMTLRKPMSLAEFLLWEERQELRWEFDGFDPRAVQRSQLKHHFRRGSRPCRAAAYLS